jgi:hypothetical protein
MTTKELTDLNLSIPPEAINLDQVIAFYTQAFVVDADGVEPTENDALADGFGVYARTREDMPPGCEWGLSLHIADRRSRQDAEALCADLNNILADFNRDLNAILDGYVDAGLGEQILYKQEGDIHAQTVTQNLPDCEPAPDAHLETAYEDSVSGWDWE